MMSTMINILRTLKRPLRSGALYAMLREQRTFYKAHRAFREDVIAGLAEGNIYLDVDLTRNMFMNPAVSRYYYLTIKILTLGGIAVSVRANTRLHIILLNNYARFVLRDSVLGKAFQVTSLLNRLNKKSLKSNARLVGPYLSSTSKEKILIVKGRADEPETLMFPLPMHPHQYFNRTAVELNELTQRCYERRREIDVLFSGGRGPGYEKKIASDNAIFGSRESILTKLERYLVKRGASLSDDRFKKQENSGEGSTQKKYDLDGLLIVLEKAKVLPLVWLDRLSCASFFLTLPGVKNPFCHNLAEALSVGTIPVCNYAHLMNPPLVDMENYISFCGEDIESAIEKIAKLDPVAILKMRQSAKKYYEENISPAGFVKKLSSLVKEQKQIILRFPYGNK